MFSPLRSVALAAAIALLATSLGPSSDQAAANGQDHPPVVVELFTSQGCAPCREADAVLGELAQRKDVIALSLHVGYWDYTGWEDPFARPEITRRQRAYASRLGPGYLYTPQAVVDGVTEVVGSDRSALNAAIRRAADAHDESFAVGVEHDERSGLAISIPAAAFEGAASVWLMIFDRERVTEVAGGENAGRRVKNYNVVRVIRRIGVWQGEPLKILVPPEEIPMEEGVGGGCAVVVQADATGRILGAHALWLPSG